MDVIERNCWRKMERFSLKAQGNYISTLIACGLLNKNLISLSVLESLVQ